MESQGSPNRQNTIENNKGGSLIIPDLKTYCKDIVIKILWDWHKDRHCRPME